MLTHKRIPIDLLIVFLVWPALDATSWLKWTAYHEIIVPMTCKLAIFVECAAFRWALWLIIFAELYMVVQYSFNCQIKAF